MHVLTRDIHLYSYAIIIRKRILYPWSFSFSFCFSSCSSSSFSCSFSFCFSSSSSASFPFAFSCSFPFLLPFPFILLFFFPRGLRGPRGRRGPRDRWDPRFPSFLSLYVFYYTFTCLFSALPRWDCLAFLDFDLLPCLSDWTLVNEPDVKLVDRPGRAVQLQGEGDLAQLSAGDEIWLAVSASLWIARVGCRQARGRAPVGGRFMLAWVGPPCLLFPSFPHRNKSCHIYWGADGRSACTLGASGP